MLKIICAGLPRTGTRSLCEALRILGYNAVHFAPERFPLFPDDNTNWHCCDDIDAVVDAPAVMYCRELMTAYPDAKIILTMRNVDEWWASIQCHVDHIRSHGSPEAVQYSDTLHTLLFGWPKPVEYWYRRRFREHAEQVWLSVSSCTSLAFDVTDGWEPLCRFVEKPVPSCPFPWVNKRASLQVSGLSADGGDGLLPGSRGQTEASQ